MIIHFQNLFYLPIIIITKMPKLVDNYVLCRKIGSGQFGEVLKGYERTTNNDIAVKVIKRENLKGKFIQLLDNEIKVLKACNNNNIIKLYDLKKTPNNFYLILQYCNQGDLAAYIKLKKHLTEQEAIQFLIQILNGFKTLVKNKIMHRDLKLANILLHDGVIKIGDFGFAKLLTQQQYFTKTVLGSPLNMAPEILNGLEYTNKADIYSIGVCFYQMLYGKPPYNAPNMIELSNLIKKQELQFPKKINNISLRTQDLIRRMLIPDPQNRIDWPDLFDHPIIQSLQQSVKNDLTLTLGKEGNIMQNISKFYIKQNLVILHPVEILRKQSLNNYTFEVVKNNKKMQVKEEVFKTSNSKNEQKEIKIKRENTIVSGKIQQKESDADILLKVLKKNTRIILNERNKYIFILSILNQLKQRIQLSGAKEISYHLLQSLLKKIKIFNRAVKNRQNIFNLDYWQDYIQNADFKLISNYFFKQNSIISFQYQQMQKFVIKNSQELSTLIKNYSNSIIQSFKLSDTTLDQISRVTWAHIDHLIDFLNIDNIMIINKQGQFNFKLYYVQNGKANMQELANKVSKKLDKMKLFRIFQL